MRTLMAGVFMASLLAISPGILNAQATGGQSKTTAKKPESATAKTEAQAPASRLDWASCHNYQSLKNATVKQLKACAAMDTEAEAEADEARQKALTTNHCPARVQIGTSEDCVYLIMGDPDHINTDALSGKQLVYTSGDEDNETQTYVYIGLRGQVEDVQTSY